jgi:spermidine synthase
VPTESDPNRAFIGRSCDVYNMTPRRRPLFVMESPLPQARFTLRLLEPPGTCQKSLWQRLFDGTYDKPFIVDSRERRALHFDFDGVQSAMHPGSPDRLSLAYTRKMMAFLLFNRNPARVLLLGLGGGSLAKFCYRHLPDAAITAVEVNPHVIALREEFRIPADDDRFRVICADGAAYLEHLVQPKDVILVDACDRTGVVPELDTIAFYERARWHCLSSGGVFVANLCGDPSSSALHLARIRAVFGEEVLTLRVKPDGNLIAIAFKESRPTMDWQRLEAAAVDLKLRFGLNFPRYVRRIGINWKLRSWEHVWA